MIRNSLICAFLMVPAAASAQMFAGYATNMAMSNLANQSLVHQSAMARARGSGPGLKASRSGMGVAPRDVDARFDREVFSYQPTSALSRQTVDGFVDRLRAKDPKASQAMAAEFSRNDYGKIYRGIIRPFGLSDDNAADPLAAYTVLGWLIATGAGDPRPSAVEAARDQIGARMASNPQISSPANRAKVAEEFKLMFVTLHAGWQAARKEGSLKQYSDGVESLFRQNGTDLRALQLTEQGFVRA